MGDLLAVMKIYLQPWLCVMLSVTVLCLNVLAAEDSSDVPLRMANGTVIEGTMQEATPDGLVIQGEKNKYTAPWKYLSAGTRYRYELPMLAAQEVARSNALKKAAAEAAKKEAAEKVAAAKAAKAAAAKAAVTNAVGVASNMPPAK
ncbi:MAG: hypothetical protein PHW60_02610 [Kiritimatiellae bacterium]|nr:hypothetical protein [Kiritimatiellia bacterium]